MSGKRAIQKSSKAVSRKRVRADFFGWPLAREGLGVAASFAGAFVGAAAGRVGMASSPVVIDGAKTGASAAPVSAPAAPVAAPAAPLSAAPGSRFAPLAFAPLAFAGKVKPGGVRDFLRQHFEGPKPHLRVAALTGVPEGTIRNAMAWNGPSELSGAHMLRLVAVFGPPFLAAVLDPVPGWVGERLP